MSLRFLPGPTLLSLAILLPFNTALLARLDPDDPLSTLASGPPPELWVPVILYVLRKPNSPPSCGFFAITVLLLGVLVVVLLPVALVPVDVADRFAVGSVRALSQIAVPVAVRLVPAAEPVVGRIFAAEPVPPASGTVAVQSLGHAV